jgi:hypothetical protein
MRFVVHREPCGRFLKRSVVLPEPRKRFLKRSVLLPEPRERTLKLFGVDEARRDASIRFSASATNAVMLP